MNDLTPQDAEIVDGRSIVRSSHSPNDWKQTLHFIEKAGFSGSVWLCLTDDHSIGRTPRWIFSLTVPHCAMLLTLLFRCAGKYRVSSVLFPLPQGVLLPFGPSLCRGLGRSKYCLCASVGSPNTTRSLPVSPQARLGSYFVARILARHLTKINEFVSSLRVFSSSTTGFAQVAAPWFSMMALELTIPLANFFWRKRSGEISQSGSYSF